MTIVQIEYPACTYKDFDTRDFAELKEYLERIPYDEGNSLCSEVRRALKHKKSSLVLPIGEFDDITIDFKY